MKFAPDPLLPRSRTQCMKMLLSEQPVRSWWRVLMRWLSSGVKREPNAPVSGARQ